MSGRRIWAIGHNAAAAQTGAAAISKEAMDLRR